MTLVQQSQYAFQKDCDSANDSQSFHNIIKHNLRNNYRTNNNHNDNNNKSIKIHDISNKMNTNDSCTSRTTSMNSSTTISDTSNNSMMADDPTVESQDVPIHTKSSRSSTSSMSSLTTTVWLWGRKITESMSATNALMCFHPGAVADTTTIVTADGGSRSGSLFASCHLPGISEDPDLEGIVRSLLRDIRQHTKKHRRLEAIQSLYRLTNKNRQHNRIPIVCTSKYDVVATVSKYCLAVDPCTNNRIHNCDDDPFTSSLKASPIRRYALLLVNNLCIPLDNKLSILYGESFEVLFSSIVQIIHYGVPESYLSIVTLLNLSALHRNIDAKVRIMSFVPAVPPLHRKLDNNGSNAESDSLSPSVGAPSTYRHHKPTDDDWALLRVIERKLRIYEPYLSLCNGGAMTSVETEFVRWSMNLFCSLVSHTRQNAITIATETSIAQVAARCLATTVSRLEKQLQQDRARQQQKRQQSTKSKNMTSYPDVDLVGLLKSTHATPTDSVLFDTTSWSINSLEDAVIMLLIHCAQYDECCVALKQIEVLAATLSTIRTNVIGIHQTRADALYRRLFDSEQP